MAEPNIKKLQGLLKEENDDEMAKKLQGLLNDDKLANGAAKVGLEGTSSGGPGAPRRNGMGGLGGLGDLGIRGQVPGETGYGGMKPGGPGKGIEFGQGPSGNFPDRFARVPALENVSSASSELGNKRYNKDALGFFYVNRVLVDEITRAKFI